MLNAPVPADSLLEITRTGKSRQMEHILELRTDVNQRGQQNETALHWMAFHGNDAMVRKLIAAGADVNVRASNGSTPLHLAAYKGHINVTRILIAGNAGVNIQTRDGITPLDWALRKDNREVAEFLISTGAKAGSSLTDAASTPRRSERKLEDLPHFSSLQPILARQRPRPRRQAAPTGADTVKVQDSVANQQTGAFRIQLAAVGTHERALEAWNTYSRKYPDILDSRDLYVEPVQVNGKTLYRVQAGIFTRHTAASVCKQLTGRRQPCLVINADPLWLAEQRKAKHP
jgi:hypothetical protein